MVLKLRDWIPIEKLSWKYLSANPNAIHLLEANPDKIDWEYLSKNSNAIHLLKANPEKIDWLDLSRNSAAIHLLEANPKKINWALLSSNPNAIHLLEANTQKINWDNISMNPAAIHMLEANPNKIDWDHLSRNPNAIHLLDANQDRIDWKSLSENPNAIHLLEANTQKINWDNLSSNPNAIHLLKANQHKIHWGYLSINPSIFIDEPKIEEPLSKNIEPTTMTTLGFDSYVEDCLYINYYSRKDSKSMYVSKDTVDKIVSYMDGIIKTINEKKNHTDSQMIQKFMEAQIGIATGFKSNQQSYSFDNDILTEDLDLIKTAKLVGFERIHYDSFEISFTKKLDYITHKEELRELLKNKKEKSPEEIPEAEDVSILEERRKLVLTFEHPNGYVNEDGSYNYNDMYRGTIRDENIEQAALMYRLRYKARKHFEDINKQEYDYAGMKKNKQQLHGELLAAMRLLKKYMDVPVALKSKE